MTSQLDLFSAPPTAARHRRDDPATSVVAAKELPLRARQQEVVEALRWLGVTATADDVRSVLGGYGLDRPRNEVASRLSELERLHVVCKVGVRKNARNKSVATWRLVS